MPLGRVKYRRQTPTAPPTNDGAPVLDGFHGTADGVVLGQSGGR